MRLLMFQPALPPYRVDLYNALAARCDFRVVFLHDNLLTQRFDQQLLRGRLLADHGYLLDGVTFKGRTMRRGVCQEIRRFGPDVVVTAEYSPTTLMVVANRAVVGRQYAHVVETQDNPAVVAGDRWWRCMAKAVVLPRIDGILVYSEPAAHMYRERYAVGARIGISPLLQDEVVFRQRLAEVTDEVHRIVASHYLTGKRVVLFVGRLVRVKQAHRLIRVFPQVQKSFPDSTLALVGDGPERGSLERLARATGLESNIIFVGRKEDAELCAWYRVASVFALPSSFEPFGAVVNEALLAGVPVVCSNRAGASGLVREGKTGAVIDAASAEALSTSLREWLGHAPPLDATQVMLRPSLMAVNFSDTVNGFLDLVRAADGGGSQYPGAA
jgi:glycosyltransferase involved in cell wall biosynthesis